MIEVYLDHCFERAGMQYGVNPRLLKAIAIVESSLNPRVLNRNKNRSVDRGIMQINSSWDRHLKKHGIDPVYVWQPCYNIQLGAMILRHCQNMFGNTWRAVDCYNKGLKARESSEYVWKVYRAYRNLERSQWAGF